MVETELGEFWERRSVIMADKKPRVLHANVRVSTRKNDYADISYRHKPFWNNRKLLALLLEMRQEGAVIH